MEIERRHKIYKDTWEDLEYPPEFGRRIRYCLRSVLLDTSGSFVLRDPLTSISVEEYKDYSARLSPSFFRGLLSDPALRCLEVAWQSVTSEHPSRFNSFNVHSRSLYRLSQFQIGGEQIEEPIVPTDTLTFVTIDGVNCYMPIDVSLGHSIATAHWSHNPKIDFARKQAIIERLIFDTTCEPKNWPIIGILGICFPERFAAGPTHQIFTDYPSRYRGPSKIQEQMRSQRRIIKVNGEPYAIYFFKGLLSRGKFEQIINDPIVIKYCEVMASAWNANFKNLIASQTAAEEAIADLVTEWVLHCLGAIRYKKRRQPLEPRVCI